MVNYYTLAIVESGDGDSFGGVIVSNDAEREVLQKASVDADGNLRFLAANRSIVPGGTLHHAATLQNLLAVEYFMEAHPTSENGTDYTVSARTAGPLIGWFQSHGVHLYG